LSLRARLTVEGTSPDYLAGGKLSSGTYNAKLRLYDCHHQYDVGVPT
jgi:hypothetical protein